ncbi:hypothetical protein OQA88_1205 [Cercophora sp. LCS_1]
MQLNNLLVFLPLLAAGAAGYKIPDEGFIIPAGLAKGTYSVTFDAAGNPIINKYDFNSTSVIGRREQDSAKFAKAHAALSKRDTRGETGRTIPEQDRAGYNSNVDDMIADFKKGVKADPHSILFRDDDGRRNSFLALCNYSPNIQGGFDWEVRNFNAVLDEAYGAWKTGWWHISGPNKSFWRDIKGVPICTNIGNRK